MNHDRFTRLERFACMGVLPTPPAPRCLVCGELRSVCTGHAKAKAVTWDGRHYSDCQRDQFHSCWCAARRLNELSQQQESPHDPRT